MHVGPVQRNSALATTTLEGIVERVVYFNEENIPVTWAALESSLSQLPTDYDWEVVFVNDGPGDRCYDKRRVESMLAQIAQPGGHGTAASRGHPANGR